MDSHVALLQLSCTSSTMSAQPSSGLQISRPSTTSSGWALSQRGAQRLLVPLSPRPHLAADSAVPADLPLSREELVTAEARRYAKGARLRSFLTDLTAELLAQRPPDPVAHTLEYLLFSEAAAATASGQPAAPPMSLRERVEQRSGETPLLAALLGGFGGAAAAADAIPTRAAAPGVHTASREHMQLWRRGSATASALAAVQHHRVALTVHGARPRPSDGKFFSDGEESDVMEGDDDGDDDDDGVSGSGSSAVTLWLQQHARKCDARRARAVKAVAAQSAAIVAPLKPTSKARGSSRVVKVTMGANDSNEFAPQAEARAAEVRAMSSRGDGALEHTGPQERVPWQHQMTEPLGLDRDEIEMMPRAPQRKLKLLHCFGYSSDAIANANVHYNCDGAAMWPAAALVVV